MHVQWAPQEILDSLREQGPLRLFGACVPSTRCHVPLFGHGVCSVAMKYGEVESSVVCELRDRRFEQVLVRAVVTPLPVPFVDVRPMDFFPLNGKLVPLNTCVENVQDVVEDLVLRELALWSTSGS